jgi:alkylhydroperoxidase family enzyme
VRELVRIDHAIHRRQALAVGLAERRSEEPARAPLQHRRLSVQSNQPIGELPRVLAWTETLTQLGREGVPDELYAATRVHFEEAELVWLTMAIVAINGWNRLCIAFAVEPGSYQPPKKS